MLQFIMNSHFLELFKIEIKKNIILNECFPARTQDKNVEICSLESQHLGVINLTFCSEIA